MPRHDDPSDHSLGCHNRSETINIIGSVCQVMEVVAGKGGVPPPRTCPQDLLYGVIPLKEERRTQATDLP